SRDHYFKTSSVKNPGLRRMSWRQHSQPQMGSNISDDLREMLDRKRSLPRPPITT
uniref:Movement protein n=1 Tax=Loa loa TaxID=7209 RepID=A0A1I7VJ31_LOALO